LLLLLHVTADVRLLLLQPAACVRSLPLQVVGYAARLLLLLHIWLHLILHLHLLLLLWVPAVVLPPAAEPFTSRALPITVLHWTSCTTSSSSSATGWDMAVPALHSSKPRRWSLNPTSSASSRRCRWLTNRPL
jgi:hypothetical protein